MSNNHGKTGVAVVGAGYWGPNLIRSFNDLGDCRVLWVCDKKPGRLQFIHDRYPDIPATDDYMKVLCDSAVEAVVIATPVSTHRDLALAALEAGKHVFVEKPLALTSEQGAEIVRVGKEAERVVAVGHIFVHNVAVVKMKELVASGKIGKLCYAESSRVNLGPPASEVNVIWDLAVHDVSILLYLWDREPVEVTAYGKRYVHPTLVDAAFLLLRFADGTMAQHHVSWLSPEKVRHFFVTGTNGSIRFDDMSENGKLRYVDRGVDTRVGAKDDEAKEFFYGPGQVVVPELPSIEPLRAECQRFLDCIRNGGTHRSNGEAGLVVVRILEAADRSIASGSNPVIL